MDHAITHPAEKTEFKAEVIRILALHSHPNAERLDYTYVNGNQVVVRKDDFKPGDLAVYVPVDAICPTDRAELAFLGGKRVRAARLRGMYSQGVLVPVSVLRRPAQPGEDVTQELGITKWLTLSERAEADDTSPRVRKATRSQPHFPMPVYGLDPLRKYPHVLITGEQVVLTEKIHGSNARYCFKGGKLYVGSHKVMRGCTRSRLAEFFDRLQLRVRTLLGQKHRASMEMRIGSVWWEIAEKYDLKSRLSKMPDLVFYGEIYGEGVQKLPYDTLPGAETRRRFRVFDIFNVRHERYLDFDDMKAACNELGLETVPELYRGVWHDGLIEAYSTGKSTLNPHHIREGFVVRPVTERTDPLIGRVSLKCVGEDYRLWSARHEGD